MQSIVTSRTRLLYERPPTGPWTLNADSIHAAGLKIWYPMLDGGGTPKNAIGPSTLAESATKPLWRPLPNEFGGTGSGFGIGRRYNGSSSYDSIPWFTTLDGSSKPNQPWTVAFWAATNTAATQAGMMSLSNTPAATFATDGNTDLLVNVGKTAGKVTYLFGDVAYLDGTTAIANQRPFQFAISVNTAATPVMTAYVNGLQDAVDSTHGYGASTSNVALLFLGTGFPVQMDGWITDVRCYTRVLSAAEVFSLYDPQTRWDLYYPIGLVTHSFPSAGVSPPPPPPSTVSYLPLLGVG